MLGEDLVEALAGWAYERRAFADLIEARTLANEDGVHLPCRGQGWRHRSEALEGAVVAVGAVLARIVGLGLEETQVRLGLGLWLGDLREHLLRGLFEERQNECRERLRIGVAISKSEYTLRDVDCALGPRLF